MASRKLLSALLLTACVIGARGVAIAQTSIGTTNPGPAQNSEGSGVAFDDKHNVYLEVWESSRQVFGRFIGFDGTLLGDTFTVGTHLQSFAGNPKVAYSRTSADDVFMVTYTSDFNRFDSGSNLFGQLVQYTGQGPSGGGLSGTWFPVSANSLDGFKAQFNNDLVFNPVSRKFLAVWEEGADVVARHLAVTGGALATQVSVSNAPNSQGVGKVDFDWQRNRYLVTYQGLAPDSPVSPEIVGTWAKMLDADTLAVGSLIELARGTSPTFDPCVVYLPEADGFLVAWTAFGGGTGFDVVARFVKSSDGSMPSPTFGAIVLSSIDGRSHLDYDWVSRKVLMGAQSSVNFLRGVVLDGVGVPGGPGTLSTVTPTNGTYLPRVEASKDGHFAVSYTVGHTQAWLERFQLAAAGTPGPHYGGGPPPPPPGGVQMVVDTPGAGSTITPPFGVGGWAVDTRATNDNGIETVHVWAVPTGGANGGQPAFVGSLTMDIDRPDVAQIFGQSHKKSGFGVVMSNLPPGQYQLVFYPKSSVTGEFDYNKVVTRIVNVNGSALTQVDSPTWAQTFPNGGVGMNVSGYAIDLNAQSGTGIDAVHVWAVDALWGSPTFLGSATLGLNHGTAATFGQQFASGGFALTYNGPPLSAGLKYILVYSHSVGSASFNVARVVGVFIQ